MFSLLSKTLFGWIVMALVAYVAFKWIFSREFRRKVYRYGMSDLEREEVDASEASGIPFAYSIIPWGER